MASQARAAYRAVNGALTALLRARHSASAERDRRQPEPGSLAFTASVKRALANDVTVCGEHEPVAYVTEYFLGDGVTTPVLSGRGPVLSAPHPSPPSSASSSTRLKSTCSVWGNPGGYGYLRLGAGGLVMDGGNGIDGETLLTWLDPVEMGGTLLLEAVGVTLSPGSTGILAGFFIGLETQSACIAGFQATAQTRHRSGYLAAHDSGHAGGHDVMR